MSLRGAVAVLALALLSSILSAPAAAESRTEVLAAIDPLLEPLPIPESTLPLGLRAYGLLPAQLLTAGAQVFFIADDREHGVELWVSDGTVEGSRMVIDLWPGEEGSFPRFLGALDGEVVFRASTPGGGRTLWASDGTAAGTREIGDPDPDDGALIADDWFWWRAPQDAPVLRGELIFITGSADECRVLATDGHAVRELDRLEQGACATRPLLADGRLFYGTWNGTWRSTDGVRPPVPLAMPACPGERFDLRGAVAFGDRIAVATRCSTGIRVDEIVPGEPPRRLLEGLGAVQMLAHGEDLWLLEPSGLLGFRVLRGRPDGPAEEIVDVPDATLLWPVAVAAGALVVQVQEAPETWPELWAIHPDGTTVPLIDQPLKVEPHDVRRRGGHLVLLGQATSGRVDRTYRWDVWTTGGRMATTRRVATFTAPIEVAGGQRRGEVEPQLALLGGDVLLAADDGGGQQLRALRHEVVDAGQCIPSPEVLCLGDDRFEVRVRYGNQHSEDEFLGEGEVRLGTADSGYFWFFRPGNLELLVKVLDGVGVNGHHWVFHGPMTNLEYWLQVWDSATGLTRTYHRAPGSLCGGADVTAFPPDPPAGGPPASAAVAAPLTPAAGCEAAGPGVCLGGRFAVEVTFRDHRNAPGVEQAGHGQEETGDSGAFWFFRPDNLEVLVKVLDGTPVNGHHWVFVGAMTDLAFEVEVLDTQTGGRWSYQHPQGSLCGTADTSAL